MIPDQIFQQAVKTQTGDGQLRLRAIHQVSPDVSIDVRFTQYPRTEASMEMLLAAAAFERRFSIFFDTFTYFPKETLNDLHRPAGLEAELPRTVTIASRTDGSILQQVSILSRVANTTIISDEERRIYYDALRNIYQKLPFRPEEASGDKTILFVGIEREGRILAESLGCLPAGRSLRPHGKRITFEDGLLIGLTEIPEVPKFAGCVIIDGAIASGATLIAIIEKLRMTTPSFRIFSAHSTFEGLRAITRYAFSEGLEIQIAVGHATAGINGHFYAILPEDPSKVVVGDLGDTISSVVS